MNFKLRLILAFVLMFSVGLLGIIVPKVFSAAQMIFTIFACGFILSCVIDLHNFYELKPKKEVENG